MSTRKTNQISSTNLPQPMYSYGAITIAEDQYVEFGNVNVVLDGKSPFSLGGWVRLLTGEGEDDPLLSVQAGNGENYGVLISGGDSLGVNWPDVGDFGYVNLPIGEWQYIVLTFEPTGNQAGTFTMYVNGDQMAQSPVSSMGSLSSGNTSFFLGNGVNAQCLNFSVWSVCLPPAQCNLQMGVPSPTPGLEICCDFTVSPAQDRSGNNHEITYSEQMSIDVVYPCLSLDGVSMAQPSLTDGVNPGGDNTPFSVCAWIRPLPPVITPDATDSWTVFANGPFAATGVSLYLQYNTTTNDFQAFVERGRAQPLASTVALSPGDWSHLAVAFDGATMNLYVDGRPSGSAPLSLPAPLAEAAPMIGATMDSSGPNGYDHCFIGNLQAISIWNICLSQTDITTYMQTEPTDAAGCVAYYSLAVDQPVNALTGGPVACYYNAAVNDYTVENDAAQLTLTRKPLSSSSDPAPKTLWDLAATSHFDLSVRPSSQSLPSEKIDEILDSFEWYLSSFAPREKQQHYREMFRRNLYHGIYLQEAARGPLPGTVTFEHTADEVVFYHHTLEGPQECGRVTGQVLTPCQSWVISVVATSIGCLLSVFGVGYTLTKLSSTVLPAIFRAALGRFEIMQAILAVNVSATTVIRIVRALGSMTSISSVIASGLSGVSWWSWAFTLASLTVQIVSLWLTGGLFLIYILAQLALGIAQLVYVINQQPSGCNPAPELTGLSPISTTAGGQGLTLSVSGNTFMQGATVNWNGSPRTTTYVSDTQLTAQITQSDIAQTGLAAITVVNPSSNNTPSNSLSFYVTAAA